MSAGEDREEVAARHTGRPRRTMVELPPRKGLPITQMFAAALCVGVVGAVALVMLVRGDRDTRLAAAETTQAATPEQPSRDPEITLTEVAPSVYHLDFGGDLCDTARCLGRVVELVNERIQQRNPREHIVSVAPLGVYGSPTALIVITAPAQ